MADEYETGAPIDVAATEALTEAPATKKQRAPRRSKAELAEAAAAKTAKAGTKRSSKAEVAPVPAELPVAKATAKGRTKNAGQAVASVATPVVTGDEFADLVQLEEENKQLRQALAEKLRAENADLRKRLSA